MRRERLFFPRPRLSARALRRAVAGKTVLVTGASRGIGADTAAMLGAAGAYVVLVARDQQGLTSTARRVEASGGIAEIVTADLREPGQVGAVLNHPRVSAGIDVFVSNAGKSIRRPILESVERHHDVVRTTALNHLAPTQLTLGLVPGLVQSGGVIVNVSAINVLLPPAPAWAAYQSSKAAFDQWLRSAAPELEAKGVAVGTVYLPLVRTAMIAPNPAYRDTPAMSPRVAAMHICRMIARRERRWTPWWLPPALLAAPLTRGTVEAIFRAQQRAAVGERS